MRINGLNPAFVYDDDAFKPGTIAFDDDSKAYIFCQADGAVAANDVCLVDEAAQAKKLTSTNSVYGDRIGVAVAALADDQYGWLQIYGPVGINAAASCAANAAVYATGTGGRIDDTDTGEVINGMALTTAAGAAGAAPGFVAWPSLGA